MDPFPVKLEFMRLMVLQVVDYMGFSLQFYILGACSKKRKIPRLEE